MADNEKIWKATQLFAAGLGRHGKLVVVLVIVDGHVLSLSLTPEGEKLAGEVYDAAVDIMDPNDSWLDEDLEDWDEGLGDEDR